jgi:hypothetical protein
VVTGWLAFLKSRLEGEAVGMGLSQMKELGRFLLGMAAAALTGALIAVVANAIYRGGADAGDWLQFFGGMLGAALAVFGAVYFERRKHQRSILEEIDALADLYDDLVAYLEAIHARPIDNSIDDRANINNFRADISHYKDRITAASSYIALVPLRHIKGLERLRKLSWSMDQLRSTTTASVQFLESTEKGGDPAAIHKYYEAILDFPKAMIANTRDVSRALREK